MTASNYEFHDCSSLRLSSAGKQTRRELLSLDSTRRTRSKCKTAPPTTPAPCFIRHKALPVRLTTRQPHYSVRNDATYVLLTIYTTRLGRTRYMTMLIWQRATTAIIIFRQDTGFKITRKKAADVYLSDDYNSRPVNVTLC